MSKIFSFGELLLRMSPVLNRQWIQRAQMPVYVGGAELNVATALAKWGVPVKFGTALPEHYLSNEIIDGLQAKGIDTSAIHFSGERIGIYYLPQGADLKHSGVIYDRAYSSFSCLQPGMIDWDTVLNDCSWFHFSAISPALNKNVTAVCKEALEVATKKKLTISVDLNYRSKLWKYGQQPVDVMPQLLEHCHVVMGNLWAAECLLGIPSTVNSSKGSSNNQLADAALQSMDILKAKYPQVHTMAYTFRLDEHYFAILYTNGIIETSATYPLLNIRDKVGSGDCFMGGLIYGIYNQQSPKEIINYAASAAVGKMQETGDTTDQTIAAVKNRMA